MYDETEISVKSSNSSLILKQLSETMLFIDAEITVVDLRNMKIFEGIHSIETDCIICIYEYYLFFWRFFNTNTITGRL